jgi:Domain of unknown function (DUF4350)
MPARLTSGDRRLFLTAATVFLILVTVAVILIGGAGDTSETPTTYSTGSGGAKASYLLLEASGYRVQRWERSVRELPPGGGVTLILAEPSDAPTVDERAAIGRFIQQGGTIIATGLSGAFFLPEHRVAPDPIAGMTWRRLSALFPSSITRAAPEMTLAPEARWDLDTSALPLYGDGDSPRVVEYRAGAGRVLWWASATPLTNAGLREAGNLEFFLACVGPGDRRVLWDEYFHGHRPSSRASATRWPLVIGVQFALFIAAVLLTYSRRSGPIVPSPVESRRSPLEFVRTLGSLYQRAGATSVAVDIAYQRFRYALTRRLGRSGHTSAADLDLAVRERWHVDQEFGAVLRACESASAGPGLSAEEALKLSRALHDYADELALFETR